MDRSSTFKKPPKTRFGKRTSARPFKRSCPDKFVDLVRAVKGMVQKPAARVQIRSALFDS